MTAQPYQQILFEKIKEQLPENQTLIDNVTDILDLSKDSGYRRLRGETALSLDEAVALAAHFNISLTEVAGQADNTAIFRKAPFIRSLDAYTHYMERSLKQLQEIHKKKDHVMIYSAKDIPIFYQFAFPKLAAFKIYVWLKSVYDIQTLDGENYSLSDVPENLLQLAKEQWRAFTQINTIEIWNDTTISSLINQITYYYEAGLLRDKEEALELCEDFRQMLKVIYKQALSGDKSHANNTEVSSGASCKMYYHEILLMDNHILAQIDQMRKLYFIPYGGLNFLTTSDPSMTNEMYEYLIGQTKKSALISDVSEKDRNRFFIRIRNRIDQLRQKIEATDPFI